MKVAILTNFMEFNPGYSLTMVVYDQTLMLKRHGHDVHLYVNEQFNPKGLDFSHVEVHQSIPFSHLTDYMTVKDYVTEHEEPERNHKLITELTADILVDELSDFNVVFTHDFIFTGWFLPYGLACKVASDNEKMKRVRWYHWVHSMPSGLRDYWNISLFSRQHKIVYPNETDRLRVAEQFRGEIDSVRVVPHIKDIRTFCNFSEETWRLIDMMPSVLSSEIMQVFPAGSDRFAAKGIDKVIKIFGNLKMKGARVCLVIANQWATGRQRQEIIQPYVDLARAMSLVYSEDFVFTSDLHPDWANGLPQRMVQELMNCSNLFIFPTHEESFGLVVPEVALAGSPLMVLNSSLENQKEVVGRVGNALWFEFSSFHRKHTFENADVELDYYKQISSIILGRLRQNESIRAKTWAKQYHNMDYLYDTVYGPMILGEDYTPPSEPVSKPLAAQTGQVTPPLVVVPGAKEGKEGKLIVP